MQVKINQKITFDMRLTYEEARSILYCCQSADKTEVRVLAYQGSLRDLARQLVDAEMDLEIDVPVAASDDPEMWTSKVATTFMPFEATLLNSEYRLTLSVYEITAIVTEMETRTGSAWFGRGHLSWAALAEKIKKGHSEALKGRR